MDIKMPVIKIPVVVQQGLAISVYVIVVVVSYNFLPNNSVNVSSAKEFILGFVGIVSSLLGLGSYTLWVNSWWNKN